MAISLWVGGVGLNLLQAEPLITQDAAQQVSPAVTADPTLVELSNPTDVATGDLPLLQPSPPTTRAAASHRPTALRLPSSALPSAPEPDTNTSLRSVIKETVRPVYNELAESGALDAWHGAKETLGLGQNGWDKPGAENVINLRAAEAVQKSQWQNTAQPPKSAAQTQFDREYDAYLLRQLIDDLKPWVLGLIGLYALGHLAKLTFNFFQWKAARRRERHAQRTRHRSSRHRRESKGEL